MRTGSARSQNVAIPKRRRQERLRRRGVRPLAILRWRPRKPRSNASACRKIERDRTVVSHQRHAARNSWGFSNPPSASWPTTSGYISFETPRNWRAGDKKPKPLSSGALRWLFCAECSWHVGRIIPLCPPLSGKSVPTDERWHRLDGTTVGITTNRRVLKSHAL
jgi:hypothetical protein